MPGATLGKYQLVAELGRGGMADVFLAVARGKVGLGFTKLVVIKRLREHLANDADFVAMLVDEARIAARLNHPNVVQMLEIDEVDGEYFLAMEYLDGQPFRRILQRKADMPGFTKTIQYTIIADVLAGLHHAHELTDYDGTPLNVVHRDATPHNVFVTYDGSVKVVDFGIAKAVGRASETRHGIIKGKVPYMAPEQAAGQVVDRRADIFSAGVMLWEAAVGSRMWQDVNEVDILRSLIRGKIPSSPREADPSVPVEIDAICKKALAFKLDERYATAAEFQADLDAFIALGEGRPGARDIGKIISDAFGDKREETKNIIEAQLAKLRNASGESFRPAKIPQSPRSTTDSEVLSFDESGVSVSPTDEGSGGTGTGESGSESKQIDDDYIEDPTLAAEDPSARKRRLLVLVGVAIGAIVIIGIAIIGLMSSSRSPTPVASSTPSASSPPVMESVSAPPSVTPVPQQITASFRADPPEARFSIDDAGVLPNPFNGKFPRDGAKHSVKVFAPGYATKVEEVTFDDDLSMQTSLARESGKRKH